MRPTGCLETVGHNYQRRRLTCQDSEGLIQPASSNYAHSISIFVLNVRLSLGLKQLLNQLLHIYKIYKIYTLKHQKRSDMFRS